MDKYTEVYVNRRDARSRGEKVIEILSDLFAFRVLFLVETCVENLQYLIRTVNKSCLKCKNESSLQIL